jgi:excisionase family DNA binding protein
MKNNGWLSARKASARLKVSVDTINRMIERREITTWVAPGSGRVLISEADVQRLEENALRPAMAGGAA